MSIVRIAVVSAGVSEPSSTRLLADRLANSIAGQLESVQVDVIDLRDIAVDVAQSMLSGFAVGGARDAVRAVEEADAVIAATPVFNASYIEEPEDEDVPPLTGSAEVVIPPNP